MQLKAPGSEGLALASAFEGIINYRTSLEAVYKACLILAEQYEKKLTVLNKIFGNEFTPLLKSVRKALDKFSLADLIKHDLVELQYLSAQKEQEGELALQKAHEYEAMAREQAEKIAALEAKNQQLLNEKKQIEVARSGPTDAARLAGYQALTEKFRAAQGEIESLHKEVKALSLENTALKNDKAALMEELAKLMSLHATFIEEHKQLMEEHAQLKAKIARGEEFNKTTLFDLQAQMEGYKTTQQAQTEEIKKLHEGQINLARQAEKKDREIAQLAEERNHYQSSVKMQEARARQKAPNKPAPSSVMTVQSGAAGNTSANVDQRIGELRNNRYSLLK